MDKNSIWGLVIIGAILIGYTYLTKPSAEEIKALQTRDSIARVEEARDLKLENERLTAQKAIEVEKQKDPAHLQETFGVFSSAARLDFFLVGRCLMTSNNLIVNPS